jgi:FkbM family methyltransferase
MIRKILNRIFIRNPDSFFKKIDGVIHVGANEGQERFYYQKCGLNVIWVEPIPTVYAQLEENIKNIPSQTAYQYLLTDADDNDVEFQIIGDNGESSSIFELADHQDVWPEIKQIESMQMKSTTLNTVVQRECIDIKKYQGLVIDTQGSELLVLRGAEKILHNFSYIKAEAANFNAYEGCCRIEELIQYLRQFDFIEKKRSKFADHPSGGGYYDLIFYRR